MHSRCFQAGTLFLILQLAQLWRFVPAMIIVPNAGISKDKTNFKHAIVGQPESFEFLSSPPRAGWEGHLSVKPHVNDHINFLSSRDYTPRCTVDVSKRALFFSSCSSHSYGVSSTNDCMLQSTTAKRNECQNGLKCKHTYLPAMIIVPNAGITKDKTNFKHAIVGQPESFEFLSSPKSLPKTN